MFITSKSPDFRKGTAEPASATAQGSKRPSTKRKLLSPKRMQSPKRNELEDSPDAFSVVGQVLVAHQVPHMKRNNDSRSKSRRGEASISPTNLAGARIDPPTQEEVGTQRSICESVGTEADQTAPNMRTSSPMASNVQNEKKSDPKGELEVNGSAYVNYLCVEKPVVHEKVSPYVVLKAAATTNTTPPGRSPSGELATPSPPPLQHDTHPGRTSRNIAHQLTEQTIYKSRTSADARGKSQETTKRKINHPRVTIKASEPKKERELGAVHKLLQHHSMVRNQHVMDFIVKQKKEKKGILQHKVREHVKIIQDPRIMEDIEKDADDDAVVVQTQAPLQPEASLAAESLAMDQKYKEKDRRSRAKEPLSARGFDHHGAVDKSMDGVQDSGSKPHKPYETSSNIALLLETAEQAKQQQFLEQQHQQQYSGVSGRAKIILERSRVSKKPGTTNKKRSVRIGVANVMNNLGIPQDEQRTITGSQPDLVDGSGQGAATFRPNIRAAANSKEGRDDARIQTHQIARHDQKPNVVLAWDSTDPAHRHRNDEQWSAQLSSLGGNSPRATGGQGGHEEPVGHGRTFSKPMKETKMVDQAGLAGPQQWLSRNIKPHSKNGRKTSHNNFGARAPLLAQLPEQDGEINEDTDEITMDRSRFDLRAGQPLPSGQLASPKLCRPHFSLQRQGTDLAGKSGRRQPPGFQAPAQGLSPVARQYSYTRNANRDLGGAFGELRMPVLEVGIIKSGGGNDFPSEGVSPALSPGVLSGRYSQPLNAMNLASQSPESSKLASFGRLVERRRQATKRAAKQIPTLHLQMDPKVKHSKKQGQNMKIHEEAEPSRNEGIREKKSTNLRLADLNGKDNGLPMSHRGASSNPPGSMAQSQFFAARHLPHFESKKKQPTVQLHLYKQQNISLPGYPSFGDLYKIQAGFKTHRSHALGISPEAGIESPPRQSAVSPKNSTVELQSWTATDPTETNEHEAASPVTSAQEPPHQIGAGPVKSDEIALKDQNKQRQHVPTYQTIYKIIETEASQSGRQEVFKFANLIGTTQYANLVESTQGDANSSQQERAIEAANSFVDLQVPTSGLVSPGAQTAGSVTFHRIKPDGASRQTDIDRYNQSMSDQQQCLTVRDSRHAKPDRTSKLRNSREAKQAEVSGIKAGRHRFALWKSLQSSQDFSMFNKKEQIISKLNQYQLTDKTKAAMDKMNDQAYFDQIHEKMEKREEVQTLTQCSKQTFGPKESQMKSVSERTGGTPTRQGNESMYNMEFIYSPYMATRIVEEHLGIMIPSPERESGQQSTEGAITNSQKREFWNSAAGGLRQREGANGSLSPHCQVSSSAIAQNGALNVLLQQPEKIIQTARFEESQREREKSSKNYRMRELKDHSDLLTVGMSQHELEKKIERLIKRQNKLQYEKRKKPLHKKEIPGQSAKPLPLYGQSSHFYTRLNVGASNNASTLSLVVGGNNGQQASVDATPFQIHSDAVSLAGPRDTAKGVEGNCEAEVQTIPDLAMESSVGTRRGSATLMPVKYSQPSKDEGTRRTVTVYKVDQATLAKKIKSDTDVTQESNKYEKSAAKGQDDSSYADVQTLRATQPTFPCLAAQNLPRAPSAENIINLTIK